MAFKRIYFVGFTLLFSFLTCFQTQAENVCGCEPLPSSKIYQGDARKKHFIGYSIDWSCSYICKTSSEDDGKTVAAFYSEYHVGEENGLEGVCEGMVYKPLYNPNLNREVYVYGGEVLLFSPKNSSSKDLQKWAKENLCD